MIVDSVTRMVFRILFQAKQCKKSQTEVFEMKMKIKTNAKNSENKNQKWTNEIETKQNKMQEMPKIVRNQPHKWDGIAKMI